MSAPGEGNGEEEKPAAGVGLRAKTLGGEDDKRTTVDIGIAKVHGERRQNANVARIVRGMGWRLLQILFTRAALVWVLLKSAALLFYSIWNVNSGWPPWQAQSFRGITCCLAPFEETLLKTALKTRRSMRVKMIVPTF